MTKVLISGCNSIKGQVIRRLVNDKPDWKATIGFDKDTNLSSKDFPIVNSFDSIFQIESWRPDVIIDFSTSETTSNILLFAYECDIPAVIGTANITECIQKQIELSSIKIPIFQSANMSVEDAIRAVEFLLKQKWPELYGMDDLK